jgi:hypothetical protein
VIESQGPQNALPKSKQQGRKAGVLIKAAHGLHGIALQVLRHLYEGEAVGRNHRRSRHHDSLQASR